MTFFSRAASIWSQGFRAVAGVIANAIELFLACYHWPVHTRFFGNGFP
jgi:hypothetical protein